MPLSVHTRVRQNSTDTSDTVLDVNPQVWPIMATGYIEVCQPLPWHQSFDPGPYTWTWSGWRWYGSPSGKTVPPTLESDEAEFLPRGRARRSANPRVGRGGAHGLGVGRGRALPQRTGEVGLALLGMGWSYSRALGCSDESMLMIISSFSLGTLVLVPDT